MALKTIIDNLDDVPEALHGEYKEVDGKFILDIDGIDAHPTVVNLKNAHERQKQANRQLSTELSAAKDKIAELPDDFDVEEWVRLKAEAPDPSDPNKKPSDEHLQSQKRVFEQRIANLEKKHADELKVMKGEISERDGVIESVLVEDGLTKALVESGVAKEYLKAARALLKPSVKVIRDDDGNRRAVVETDLGEDEIGRYVANWSQSDEGKVFIAKPTGGDARGGDGRNGGPNPFKRGDAAFNVTEQGRVLKADPAKAKRMMQQAGWSDQEVARVLPA